MEKEEQLSRFEVILSLFLILVVLGTILMFGFKAWRLYQQKEQASWEAARRDFSSQMAPVLELMQADFSRAISAQTETNRISLNLGKLEIIYQNIYSKPNWGRLYRLKQWSEEPLSGEALLEGLNKMEAQKNETGYRLVFSQFPPNTAWKGEVELVVYFNLGDTKAILPAAINSPRSSRFSPFP